MIPFGYAPDMYLLRLAHHDVIRPARVAVSSGMDRLTLPQDLVDAARQEGRQAWLATIPGSVRRAAHLWSLKVGEPFQPGGQTAWVAPAYGPSGERLVLKIAWRHPEAAHEAQGLLAWDGRGVVRLHATEDLGDTVALLLERCLPGTPLSARPEPEQDAVIAGLLRTLWIPPPADLRFRPLEVMCRQWADEFEQAGTLSRGPAGGRALDPGLARAGVALFRELPASAGRDVLLCTDLHAGNALAAEREPWLVIDAKPYVGDPTYDPLQHMLNCDRRLRANPRGLARLMAGLLGLDGDRLLLWLFARCVIESANWPPLADVARRIAPA
jgi:streptomycin 6-kinase